MYIAAVICAAGASTRMNGIKKEYRPLPGTANGMTVLGAAVSAFAAIPEVKTIIITVPENGEKEAKNAMPPRLIAEKDNPQIHFITGGVTRQASVFKALSFLAGYTPDFVLIHDGARPWVSASLITRIIAETAIHSAVIPLLPLTETPKETDAPIDADAVFIKRHLKRAAVGAAQTPQGFAFPEILAAHEQAARENPALEFTDDAEIWAAFCGPVAAIIGESENRKITFPEDLT